MEVCKMAQQTKKHPGNPQPMAAVKKQNKWMRPTVITAAIAVIAVIGILAVKGVSATNEPADKTALSPVAANSVALAPAANGDLVIAISDITSTAKFYPVEIDGTKLEVIAVKAPDGTIRTAFNTCQVCYSSGRGYYKQEGNVLVCQNCGNRFGMDQVEVLSGGCNPVPIFPENKTVDATNITISKDFLTEAKVIFANWKKDY